MAVSTQLATATADADGDGTFMFPDVPSGELWIGTVTIPSAPASAAGTVDLGGSPVGPLFGPGIYGPYIAGPTRRLSLSVGGLTPGTQYTAVWHADDEGQKYSTWPGTVTTTVEGTVVIPTPVDVTVTAPDPLPVDGTVDVGNFPGPTLVSAATGGTVSMTGGPISLPNHAATVGVTLWCPSGNAHIVQVNGATLSPGEWTPLLPVNNSDVFTATGTSGDVLSFLVT
jgi:hypothetical protein